MQTILITGASRGIGRALAERFLANGDFVIGTTQVDTNDFQHERLVMLRLELTRPESREQCAAEVRALGKKIDVLVNNAGIWHPKDDTPEIHADILHETLEVNLVGPIDFTERVLPLLARGGRVINISSRRGSMTNTTDSSHPCYGISKAGLNMFTRVLAARLGRKAIVCSVHPGSVKTDLNPTGTIQPEEAAEEIFALSQAPIETGQFWYKGKQFPW